MIAVVDHFVYTYIHNIYTEGCILESYWLLIGSVALYTSCTGKITLEQSQNSEAWSGPTGFSYFYEAQINYILHTNSF